MTELYHINVDMQTTYTRRGKGLPPACYERFAAELPDLIRPGVLRFSLQNVPANDPNITRVLWALENAGVDVMEESLVREPRFTIRRTRQYTADELMTYDYTHLCPQAELGDATHDGKCDDLGLPYLKTPILPHDAEWGKVQGTEMSALIAVRGKLKTALENSKFRGLRLVQPVFRGLMAPKESEKVWFIWSDITLPAALNVYRDRNHDLRSFQTPLNQGGVLYEGYGFPPEIHYLKSDLEPIAGFDVALTRENFGMDSTPQPMPIYSRRFLHFLSEEFGLPLEGQPVHLDNVDDIPWVGPYPEAHAHANKRPEGLRRN